MNRLGALAGARPAEAPMNGLPGLQALCRPRNVAAVAFALATLFAAEAVRAQAVAPPVARDMREETQRIGVTVKDLFGREETREIPVTIFRPRGDGPFPLVIMNHGRAVGDQRAAQARERFENLSRYLVGKGFVVMLPTRVGYADTYGEFDPDGTGACSGRRLEPMAEAVWLQEQATLALARTLPYVDTSRWLVAGQSFGGLATGIVASRQPPGLVGAINFAGGTGGNPEERPGRPCDGRGLARYWNKLAATAKVPAIWLYWQNDLFWGADLPREWSAAWLEAGGKVEFHSLPAVGKDGHGGLLGDMDHWVPLVDAFLARLGFAGPGTPARPAPSGFAAVTDVAKVPLPEAGRERGYSRFVEAKSPRAFAIGPRGVWGWGSGDWALGKALGNCQRQGEPCKLYAVDDEVVWVP